MGKMQMCRLLICSYVVLSISSAQQTPNGSFTRNNALGIVPTQLHSGFLRRNPITSSVVRTHSPDNQSATAEHKEQKQTQGSGARAETPQLQTVADFGPQQQHQLPGFARPGPPYFGFNFAVPSAFPQQPESAAQSGSPQTAQQIQPRATPFYPNGFAGFNYQTSADFLNRFSPPSQPGNSGISNSGSSSASSETGLSSGNDTPTVQAHNFGTNFGGSIPFPSGFNQGFPQHAFPSSGFGALGQGNPTRNDGSQGSVIGFYGGSAPNIGSYSFTGVSQQEQQFQPQIQNSFQSSGFEQNAGFGQFPSGAGFEGFGQFGFGPSRGLAGSELGNGDIQSTQPAPQTHNDG